MIKDISEKEREKNIRMSLRQSFMVTPNLEWKVRHNLEVISQFMSKKDIPAWYRGKSNFQAKALERLQHSIRDDRDQKTAHRVRAVLHELGIDPLVSDNNLKFVMLLSRGNDLAFLWFLMEMFYKTPGTHKYCTNEQLILTGIVHLDMVTTLRELDRILPPGHESKRQIARGRQRQLRLKAEAIAMRPHKPCKKHSLPYFDKLHDPIHYGKPLWLPRPYIKANLKMYEIFRNKRYVPANEQNRWYADYNLREGLRLVNSVIKDVLQEAISLSAFAQPPVEVRGSNAFFESKEKPTKLVELMSKRSICRHHRLEAQERRSEHLRREIERKAKLMQSVMLFAKDKEKKELVLRIRDDLERNVAAYRLQYGSRQPERIGNQNTVRVIGREGYCEYLIGDSYQSNCVPSPVPDATTNGSGDAPNNNSNINTTTNNNISTHGAVEASRLRAGNAAIVDNLGAKTPSDNQSTRSSRTKPRLSFNANNQRPFGKFPPPYDEDFNELETPNSSQRYFEVATAHKPYQFNYDKIFHYQIDSDTRATIKEKCVEALSGDVHTAPKLVDRTPNLGRMASQCANDMRNRQEAIERARVLDDEPPPPPPPASDPYPPDMPRLSFYDCDDKNLMRFMLKTALEHMRKNRRFVLASLPEAYKLPYLNEWICQRYGKRYTRRECVDQFNETVRLISSLDRTPTLVPAPATKLICKRHLVDYSCHPYVVKKANIEKKKYYTNLNNAILEQSRIFWFALRGYLCPKGPPRDTFFAYEPSRNNEVKFVKPWKPYEKKDAKTHWEARWKKKESQKKLA